MSHVISPPPPWISPIPRIKYHMVKVPHLWVPPPKKKNSPTMEFVLEEICHRGGRFAIWCYFPLGKFCHGISSGGGGGVAIWYYFPLGKFCYGISSGGRFGIWYSFIENVFAIWYNFRVDNLPWYLFPHHAICVGGIFTIEGEALPYCIVPPLGKFCHGFSSGEGLPYGIPSGGTFSI